MSGPTDLPTYGELVAAAAKAVGADNARQLAAALGYTGRDDDKMVRNWLNGTNAPSYDGTMRLLEAAGWLNVTGGKPAKQPSRTQEQRRLRLLKEARDALNDVLGDDPTNK